MAEEDSAVGLLTEGYSGIFTKLTSQAQHALRFPTEVCRLLVVGKTGNGKSDTANHLYGDKHFKVGDGLSSTSMIWEWGQVNRFGVSVEIVDTPGIFDTGITEEVVNKNLVRSLGQLAPGPHAVLFVVRADVRFTREEAEVNNYLCSLFGKDITKHVIVVFTHGDHLKKKDIQSFLEHCPDAMKTLLELTSNRYVVFDNTLDVRCPDNDLQVMKLLVAVKDLLIHTNNSHFTSPFFTRCQEIMVGYTSGFADMIKRDLNSAPVRDLVMHVLHAKTNLDQILEQTLDVQAIDKVQQEQRDEELEELKKVLQAVLKTNEAQMEDLRNVLKLKNETIQKLTDELEAEKKKKKCTIL